MKKLLSLVLSLVLCSALGAPVYAVGSNGDITYPVDGGNIYFDAATGTITGCDNSLREVTIPNTIYGHTVISIGSRAFNRLQNKVVFPSTLKRLENESLIGSSISPVFLPDGIEYIGDFAFSGFSGSIVIPSSVRQIGNGIILSDKTHIYYGGGETEWNDLIKRSNLQREPEYKEIHYNNTDGPANVSDFLDVFENEYYADAVKWATDNGITTGTGNNQFSPWMTCTRGQVVTFLWRAAGKPEPQSTVNPFQDVKESDWFFKPVLWAVEQGITVGTGNSMFSPNQECVNAQIITFLWRAKGKPSGGPVENAAYELMFDKNAWYADAYAWAYEKKIVDAHGFDGTAELPDGVCYRKNVVTFMYNAQ